MAKTLKVEGGLGFFLSFFLSCSFSPVVSYLFFIFILHFALLLLMNV